MMKYDISIIPSSSQPMKRIAIFFSTPGYDSYPFDEAEYRDAYHQIGSMLAEKGAEATIVRDPQTYRGGMRFRGGWVYRDGAFQFTDDERDYDLIFNKGRFRPDDGARVINPMDIEDMCTDKWRTYEQFRDLCARTERVFSADEVTPALSRLTTDMIVAKPLNLEGGTGVLVLPKDRIAEKIPSYPYLLQEFIDSSNGIDGITDQAHDLRLILVNGQIVSTLLRMPKKGSYLANVSQGGSKRIIDLQDIPASARAMCQRIDATFSRFPHRIYSVDMALDADSRWKIIELNSQPGLSIDDYRENALGKNLFEKLVDLLVSAAR
jgi:glutathione synthase/RimK-type ligase-like ATP-grasp enzyme